MLDIIDSLKDAKIPSILTIGGVILILLAVGVEGVIKLPNQRQRHAGITGAILLFLGIILFVVPSTDGASPPNTATNLTPTAATIALISTSNTATAVSGGNTSTPTPELKLIEGPFDGKLIHDASGNYSVGNPLGVSLQNFVIEGTLVNPYAANKHLWSFAMEFRELPSGSHFSLIILSNSNWEYGYGDNQGKWNLVGGGKLSNLVLDEGGENRIRVTVFESKGCLYVNDKLVTADLDLSGIQTAGNITLITGGVPDSQLQGATTEYKDFKIYRAESFNC